MWPTLTLIVHRGMEVGSPDRSEKRLSKYSEQLIRKSETLEATFRATRENFSPPPSGAGPDSGPVSSRHAGVQRSGTGQETAERESGEKRRGRARGASPQPRLRCRGSGARVGGPPSGASLPFSQLPSFPFFFSFRISPHACGLSC